METRDWQLQIPLDAIIFDCDGTLSAIEGIDELAEMNGLTAPVKALTAEAMGKTGMSLALYQQRLALVKPTCEQVKRVGEQYFSHKMPDIEELFAILKRLNKQVYILSAGLYPAVALFGAMLQIPRENIFAVDIYFDKAGDYVSFDQASPLVHREGKRVIAEQIKKKYPRILCIGDGLNDYAMHDTVTRFVGFGGAYYRENIAVMCEYYITALAALLPLILTHQECEQLTNEENAFYQKGVASLRVRS